MLVYPNFHLTRLRDGDLNDQFPEPEGVVDVEVDELEEAVDKPRTTTGTKFSVLHCIQVPFKIRCGFGPLIHSYEFPCSSQSFPSDKTAGVSSRTFIVKNISNSLT